MAFKTKPLCYLGGLSGRGCIVQHGKTITSATFDLDGYVSAAEGVSACGEIRLRAEILKGLFGSGDLQLLTERGQVFEFGFSDSILPPASCAAHIDVTGLVDPDDWSRRQAANIA
jgi:hypothetical protein